MPGIRHGHDSDDPNHHSFGSRFKVPRVLNLAGFIDVYIQNSEKLDRIKTEVGKHEFILKRIK